MTASGRLGLLVLVAMRLQAAALELTPGSLVVVNPLSAEDAGDDPDSGGGAVVLDAEAGLLLSLVEVLDEAQRADPEALVPILLPGGRRLEARQAGRGAASTALLLRLPEPVAGLQALPHADSRQLRIGDGAWSAGNPSGAITIDGVPALSRGVVSGLYTIPQHAPPVRGRRGRILSGYRGPVIETSAAINDGNQGGALLDDAGRLIGLCSLGAAHERRMGTAVPLHLLLADLELPLPTLPPAGQQRADLAALQAQAGSVAAGLALVYFERLSGLGNPRGVPRPQPIDDSVPRYRREALQQQWDRYYHQQQVFYTDQAVPALVIDAASGLLLTAAENLHGDARSGFIIGDGDPIRFRVHGVHTYLDLAVLQAEAPLSLPELRLADDVDLHAGDSLGLVGRHRDGGPYTLTTGIVSAIDRRVAFENVAQSPFPLHQTDAAANYGSLGGPLIDVSGRVVGMLVRIGPTYPWMINSGVAIFIDSRTILRVWSQLAAGRDLAGREIIGIGITSNWQDGAGATVTSILPDSAATAAGLRVGDRVIGLDGQALEEPADLHRALIRRQAGDLVELRVQRGGEVLHLQVELRLL